jgi:hypothetical protein
MTLPSRYHRFARRFRLPSGSEARKRVLHAAATLAVSLTCVALPQPSFSQEAGVPRHPGELKILRFAPSDSGVPGSIFSVTFEHAIAGVGDKGLEADRLMSVTPNVAGKYEWFDATTIRFVPRDVIAPGSAFVISLDTAAIASAGARKAPRYDFPVSFRGARPLAMVVEERSPTGDWALGPLPTFRVLYSTAVEVDSVVKYSRLVFNAQCGGTISLKMASKARAVVKGESKIIENAGGFYRDTTVDRFRRVVELQPTDSLRPNCLGVWQVASFDNMRPRDGWRYGVRTAPPFAVSAVQPCVFSNPHNTSQVCEPDGLSVVFSSEVAHVDFVRAVHVAPVVPLAPPRDGATTIFAIPGALTPHQDYTVTIDPSLHDKYGRRLNGPTSFTVTAHDPVTNSAPAWDLFSEAAHRLQQH